MKIVVGSRGSKLALIQTNWVINEIKKKNPNIDFEIKVIKTKGDKILDKSLDKIGDKGLFVKEIENALLNETIDIAVHSMKDMPTELPNGLVITKVPKREDYRDVLILKDKINSLNDIPYGAKIGTGSKRRKYQLLNLRPDLNIVPIRGNVETRIDKIYSEGLYGVLLAAAGVKRLGLNDKISYYFSKDELLPAPSQGALAIEIKNNRNDLIEIINKISDEKSNRQIIAERSFLKNVNGSCHIPIGAYCDVTFNQIILEGILGDEEGNLLIRKKIIGNLGEEEKLGQLLARRILKEIENER